MPDNFPVFGCVWMSGPRSEPPETLLVVFLWAANSKTNETPVTVTGRSRDVIQRQARVFGPGYKEHQSG